MKVFISWSGDLSKASAESLRKFLPCMIQGLEVFASQHDLESGTRWGPKLAVELEGSSFGIICLTADNQAAPWILYEAGALTKLADGRACGLLLDELTPANVSGPLAQFQHRRMVEDEFLLLFRDLNQQLPSPLKDDQLRMVFAKWWPDLDTEYKAILARKPRATKGAPTQRSPARNDRELLEEILERIRVLPLNGLSSFKNTHDITTAIRAVSRIIQSRPQLEQDVLVEINRLKDIGNQDAVEELPVAEPEAIRSLLDAGLIWRDTAGKLVLNRFVGDAVLPTLRPSYTSGKGSSSTEAE